MMHSTQKSGWQVLVANRKALVSCLLGLFFIALVADLRADGVGHGQTLFKRDTTTSDTAIWLPAAGVKWQIQLIDAVEDTTVDADIWDIDLFDNTAETITTLKNKGHKVICYFSAGTYEDWRSDVSKFDTADFGSNLDEWPGERWLNIKSNSVRSIMSARLDLAKEKGCDGVDPDNIDAYGNENGLSLTEADSIDFLTFLASESHSRGMSIGLKNGGDIIGSVIDKMQWSVNEQCAEYNECDVYAAFTEVNKPVFHIEYSDETIESSSSDSGSASSTTDEDSDASTTTSVASATATATSDTETEDEDDATDGAVKAIDSTTTTASSAQVSATASSVSGVASKTSTSSAATATSSDSATEDSTDDVDDEDEDNDEDEDEDDDEEEDAEDAEDAEDEADDDEDDKEDDEETTDVKPKHRYGHGHHKLRARATLSVSLKNTACNAASADKFSTVIKNMNLDAWVEYC